MEVSHTAAFVHMLVKLPKALQEEALEKIDLLLKGRYSFSVNYKTRIVFNDTKTVPKEARLDAIGDHDIYQ